MALERLSDQMKPTPSPEDWVEWFLYRLQQEPWALGGAVVIGLFALGALSLVVFALVFGCCCDKVQEKRRRKKSDNLVL